MGLQTGQAVVFRVADADPVANRCEGPACDLAGVVTDPGIVTGVVLVGLAALVAFAYVQDASETCQRERRRVLDERDAFVEFAERVEALNPVAPESATTGAADPPTVDHHAVRPTSTGDVTLQRLLLIYDGTVMSVPHYEEEYDETVSESLAAELGPDLATSLSANKVLSPSAQREIVRRSREVAAARESLAEAVETELDALSDADAELTAIDRRRRHLMEHLAEVGSNKTDAAIDVWHRLNDLEAEAESVAIERQQDLRDPPMRPDTGITDAGEMAFYDYLYGGTDGPRHPVLSQVADVTATIRTNLDCTSNRISDGS
ncbi:hypothetical protein [Halorubrum sp. CBA1229]|uniref:DUF7260 family protein n=1 Tax=Halorubrum sp. CBA1229 TaxID=1853699 RepID=UPI0015949799|nr:hypothetical protein [Halorubrum sp. CBA1229]QKY18693.1 hypothetical protein Hrr1229_017510 [Halorubrum sp. CBA1229]